MILTIKKVKQLLDVDTLLALDYETYFDQRYTLRVTAGDKLTTSEYVRDKRFKAQCVGLRTDRQRAAQWYPHEKIARKLASFDWSRTAVLAHHNQFDGLILSHHYDIRPKAMLCTLSMARAWEYSDIGNGLDELAKFRGYGGKEKVDALGATKGIRDLPPELMGPLGAYCCDDVDDMWEIFKDMLAEGFPGPELKLIDTTIKAFTDPVLKVNKARTKRELKAEVDKRKVIFGRTAEILGTSDFEATKKILNSAAKYKTALESQGAAVAMKPGKKGPTPALAKTDPTFLALEKHENEDVRTLYEARRLAKATIATTRPAKLLMHADPALPVYYGYCRAHTKRWGGGDGMNPQNLPRGGDLRNCIKAPNGYMLVVMDLSQIEDRMNCWVAGQNDVLDIYRVNGDPYCHMASQIYGFDVTKADKDERMVGKVSRLQLGYQSGAQTLANTFELGVYAAPFPMPIEQAQRIVTVYRTRNYAIKRLWGFAERCLNRMINGEEFDFSPDNAGGKKLMTFHPEGIDLPSGLTMWYRDLTAKVSPWDGRLCDFSYQSSKRERAHLYGGKTVENWTQALSRIPMGDHINELSDKYRVVMTTHDEAAFLVPYKKRISAYEEALEVFSTSRDWYETLPLAAEGGWAKEYGAAK